MNLDNQIIKMPSGSSFKAPITWLQNKASKNYIHMIGPENDLSIYFIELPITENLEKLAVIAWEHIEPQFNLEPYHKVFLPTDDVWEKVYQIFYETPASESRVVAATICSYNNYAYVCLLDGATASFSRRGADLATMLQSWKPLGAREEITINENQIHEWNDHEIHEFENFVSESMKKLQVPGVAISIIKGDGNIFYQNAFGVKQISKNDPINLDTPFMIGSLTKSLTTLLMAKLVDLKQISWDTPVTDILKDFTLKDSKITQQLNIRHTVSAATGMPRRDLDWIFKFRNIKPEDRLLQMRSMSPTNGFGETFQYSNYLVMAGGYASAHAYLPDINLEDAYALAMQKLVFEPLKMEKTVLKIKDAVKLKPAMPHGTNFKGKLNEIPIDWEEACYSIAPSGAIWSTAKDLSKYMLLELNLGMSEEKSLISKQSILERRKNGIKISEKAYYGLGLVITHEHGLTSVGHGGNTLGFSSDLFFFPEKNIGMVILTNARQANSFLLAVKQKFIELTFSAKKRSNVIIDLAILANESLLKNNEKVLLDFENNKWIDDLLGSYYSDILGNATIYKTDNKYYIIKFEEWESKLGTKIEINGERSLILIDGPFPGTIKLQIENNNGLIIDGGQDKYHFSKIQ